MKKVKDFPVFSTQNGVGSLILKEIPYRQTAYIRISDSQTPDIFLEECVSFCKTVGAEHIYATGHDHLQAWPLHTAILQMQILRCQLPDTDAALFPVTEQTLAQWRELYNRRMMTVPNAAYMTEAEGQEMLSRGEGYFIHRGKTLLGIGMASGNRLQAVASAVPGAGRDCVLALSHALSGETVELDVAAANVPAMELYERLGFVPCKELSRWYKIL